MTCGWSGIVRNSSGKCLRCLESFTVLVKAFGGIGGGGTGVGGKGLFLAWCFPNFYCKWPLRVVILEGRRSLPMNLQAGQARNTR